jgi:hypothetical protein
MATTLGTNTNPSYMSDSDFATLEKDPFNIKYFTGTSLTPNRPTSAGGFHSTSNPMAGLASDYSNGLISKGVYDFMANNPYKGHVTGEQLQGIQANLNAADGLAGKSWLDSLNSGMKEYGNLAKMGLDTFNTFNSFLNSRAWRESEEARNKAMKFNVADAQKQSAFLDNQRKNINSYNFG